MNQMHMKLDSLSTDPLVCFYFDKVASLAKYLPAAWDMNNRTNQTTR